MKRSLNLIAENAAMMTLAYFALFQNVSGAMNLLAFLIIALAILSTGYISDYVVASLLKMGKRNPLYRVSIACDLIIGACLVWFGHWFVALFVIYQLLMAQVGWSKVYAKQAEANSELV